MTGGLDVDGCLSGIVIQDLDDGSETPEPASGLFVLIGSLPHTDWVDGVLQRDKGGFIVCGPDIAEPGHGRAPFLVETSMPGVFAVPTVFVFTTLTCWPRCCTSEVDQTGTVRARLHL